MRKKRHCLLLFLIGGSIYGCITPRYMYAPSPPNVPELRKKNDVHASALLAAGDRGRDLAGLPWFNRGYELQGAWAFANKFALQGQLGQRYERNNYSASFPSGAGSVLYTRKNWELGLGYFQGLGRSKEFFYAVFAGVGNGKLYMDDVAVPDPVLFNRSIDVDLSKVYLQQSLLFTDGKVFSAFLSCKINEIFYRNFVSSYNGEELNRYGLDGFENGRLSRASVEGTLGLRFTHPKMNFISVQASGTLAAGWFNHRDHCGAIGFNLIPSALFHRSKKQSAD